MVVVGPYLAGSGKAQAEETRPNPITIVRVIHSNDNNKKKRNTTSNTTVADNRNNRYTLTAVKP